MFFDEYKKIMIPGWAISIDVYQQFLNKLKMFNNIEVANFGYFNELQNDAKLNFNLENGENQLSDYVGDNKSVIFCHSLGSVFALKASLLNKNIKAVVVFSGFGRFAEDQENWQFGQSVRSLRAMKMMLRKNVAGLLENFYSNCASPEKWQYPIPTEHNKKLLQEGLDLLKTVDIRNILAKITVPVLFIHGDEDIICNCNVAHETVNMMKSSRLTQLHTIKNGGHNLLFNNVTEWQQIIVEFVEKIKDIS